MLLESVGYLSVFGAGLLLGLLGGGGSILLVPILVYIFKLDITQATAISLLVIGGSTLRASYSYFQSKLIHGKALLYFGIASLVGVVLTRALILPTIPNEFTVFGIEASKRGLVMLVFSVLMIVAAVAMLQRKPREVGAKCVGRCIALKMIMHGFLIGSLTAFVGAGGGFLIIPSLVYLLAVSVRKAMGTSLVLVTVQSFVGFFSDQSIVELDWVLAISILAVTLVGVQVGLLFNSRLPASLLKRMFGYLIMVIAVFIVAKELL